MFIKERYSGTKTESGKKKKSQLADLPTHKDKFTGNSLVVQWLELRTSTVGDPGWNPGQGNKICVVWPKIIRTLSVKGTKLKVLSFN